MRIKKGKNITVLYIIILLSLVRVNALNESNLELVKNTDQCLGNCESIFRVTGLNNPIILTDSNDLILDYIKTTKSNNLNSLGFKILANEIYTVKDSEKVNCVDVPIDSNETFKGGFETVCETKITEKEKTRQIWKDFNPIGNNFPANKDTLVKVVGQKKIKIGENNIDWQIELMGIKPDWAWWNSTWNYCKNITISNAQPIAINNFIAPINVTYDSDMQTDFDDIRFVSNGCNGDGYELPFDLDEKIDSNYAYYWVKANLTDSDTTIGMYYGNALSDSGEDEAGTWDDSYNGVWHFEETSGMTYDETSNNNDATPTSTNQDNVCILGNCYYFDGTNSYILIADNDTLDSSGNITAEAWIYIDNLTYKGYSDTILAKYSNPTGYGFTVSRNSPYPFQTAIGTVGGGWDSISSDYNAVINTWYYMVWTWDVNADTLTLYINGNNEYESNTPDGNIVPNNMPFAIGTRPNLDMNGAHHGYIDESRISMNIKDKYWINETFWLVTAQDNYVEFGNEETATTTSTSSTSSTTLQILEYSDYFCDGNKLIQNYTWLNTTNETAYYVNEYNSTICQYNCSEGLFGDRCNNSPTISGMIIFGIMIFIFGTIYLLVKFVKVI